MAIHSRPPTQTQRFTLLVLSLFLGNALAITPRAAMPAPTPAAELLRRQANAGLSSSFSAQLVSVSAQFSASIEQLQASVNAQQSSAINFQRASADAERTANAIADSAVTSASSVQASASAALASANAAVSSANARADSAVSASSAAVATASMAVAAASAASEAAAAAGVTVSVTAPALAAPSSAQADQQAVADGFGAVCSPAGRGLAIAGIVLGAIGLIALSFAAVVWYRNRRMGWSGSDDGSEMEQPLTGRRPSLVESWKGKLTGDGMGWKNEKDFSGRPSIGWPQFFRRGSETAAAMPAPLRPKREGDTKPSIPLPVPQMQQSRADKEIESGVFPPPAVTRMTTDRPINSRDGNRPLHSRDGSRPIHSRDGSRRLSIQTSMNQSQESLVREYHNVVTQLTPSLRTTSPGPGTPPDIPLPVPPPQRLRDRKLRSAGRQ